MSVQITVTGDRELIQRLNTLIPEVRRELLKRVTRLALDMVRHVRTNKLSGQVLNHRTGRLWRSIFQRVAADTYGVVATVASSSDVPYAGIHEFGGRTRPHDIVARRKKALAFMIQGNMVFAKRVRHPGSNMPERSFLRSSLTDMRARIDRDMKDAVAEGVRQAMEGRGRK